MTDGQFTDDDSKDQVSWYCPCPGCHHEVRADPGTKGAPWVYVCEGSCESGRDLWEALQEEYGCSGTELWAGPHAASQCGWTEGDSNRSGRRPDRPPEPLPSDSQFAAWERDLRRRPDVLAWLDARGLEGVAGKWKWGYGQPHPGRPPGLIIPIPPRRPVTYRVRYWPELWDAGGNGVKSGVKYAQPAGHALRLWPYIPEGGFVVLCEGELDAALMWRHGFRCVGSPGMQVKRELLVELGQSVDGVAVVFDVGEKAKQAADRAVEQIPAEAWSVRLPMPREHDDLTDWFCTYHRTATDLRRIINAQRPKEN